MNKKAALTDAIHVPIYLMVLVITTFIGIFIWLQFQTNFAKVVMHDPSNTTIVNAMNEITVGLYQIDYMFPVLVVGLLIISLIFAFKTGSSVVYAFLSIILWGFAMLVASILTNTFEVFKTSFPTVSTQFIIMTYFMDNIKWVVLAWLFLISAVMFTRNKREDQQLAASEMAFG